MVIMCVGCGRPRRHASGPRPLRKATSCCSPWVRLDRSHRGLMSPGVAEWGSRGSIRRQEGAGEGGRLRACCRMHAWLLTSSSAQPQLKNAHTQKPAGTQDFASPGDHGFPMGGFVQAASSKAEADKWKAYFKDLRQEMCKRVLQYLFNEDGSPNKWWMCFSKKKFMCVDRFTPAMRAAVRRGARRF
jgi:hypothetical protein